MNYHNILENYYSKEIQLAPSHIEVIASTIALRSPGCKLLIFGCGYDSAMWQAMNRDGTTVFLENSPERRDLILRDNPQLDIHLYEPVPMTIDDYTERPELLKTRPPDILQKCKWDVIVIDGPPGDSSQCPGRALVIKWVSSIRTRSTHVFLDDYERPLETFYAKKFLKRIIELKCPYRRGKTLAWSLGIEDGLMSGATLKEPESHWKTRKSAVLFLFEANFITPFRVFLKSLEHAVAARGDIDLVVLTDDRRVQEDPFVNQFVDKVILLSDKDLEKTSQTQGAAVSPDLKHDRYNKYTFVKFLAFSDFGYKEHLFFDVDMLCLDPTFRFQELFFSKTDFSAAPTCGSERLRINKGKYDVFSQSERDEAMQNCLLLAQTPKSVLNSINSGVMYIGSRLICSNATSRLIYEATRTAYTYEQNVTGRVIGETEGFRWKSMSVMYNLEGLPSYVMGENNFESIRNHIKLIHFNLDKPWHVPREQADWFQLLWWKAYDIAFKDLT
jgi:Protein of unknown function (DUF579).